jgi:hypothetical protein
LHIVSYLPFTTFCFAGEMDKNIVSFEEVKDARWIQFQMKEIRGEYLNWSQALL